MANNAREKIRVSKLNAARRQLDCAIELWFADKDDVSIHTLAAAAHQIIHDINQQKGGGELLFDSAKIRDEYRREFISLAKAPMNFFKHANRDAGEILEFSPFTSVILMMFSISGLERLGEIANDVEQALFCWLVFHRPNLITTEYQKVVQERIPVDYHDEIRAISKSEFFRTIMRARAEVRARGLA